MIYPNILLKMETKVLLILVFCGILSQGICNLSEGNNAKSSDIHNRQKRVAGGRKRPLEHAPYLVAILENGNFHSPATLLTADVAITTAQSFKNKEVSTMIVQSRSAAGLHAHHFQGLFFLDTNYNASYPTYKNLVLVKFFPPINFEVSLNQPIRIHNGSLVHERLQFYVFNWGKETKRENGLVLTTNFRSIPVRLMSYDYCQQVYPGVINAANICTYGVKAGQHCVLRDYGAPLIVENNLLGIMAFREYDKESNPDVFMNLMNLEIRRWIHERVPNLNLF